MKAGVVVGVLLGLPAAALLLLLALPKEGAPSNAPNARPEGDPDPEGAPPLATASPAAPREGPETPREPTPAEHVPGSGRLVPFDLTRVAPRALGTTTWAKLLTTPEEWKALFDEMHAAEMRNPDPLKGTPPPPAFDPALESVLVVGLGSRPRMDYDLMIEPVAPRYGEVRYRMKVEAYPGMVAEVVTWPAQAYRVPRAPIESRGLAVVDADGNEILTIAPRGR